MEIVMMGGVYTGCFHAFWHGLGDLWLMEFPSQVI